MQTNEVIEKVFKSKNTLYAIDENLKKELISKVDKIYDNFHLSDKILTKAKNILEETLK
jgi:hypothetical protein|tara:strand:+ start:526 stop:702 length:177 start_codon:yes stop_codon:yes gene_type:complete